MNKGGNGITVLVLVSNLRNSISNSSSSNFLNSTVVRSIDSFLGFIHHCLMCIPKSLNSAILLLLLFFVIWHNWYNWCIWYNWYNIWHEILLKFNFLTSERFLIIVNLSIISIFFKETSLP